MIRAALEGVLYNLYTVYLALIEVMNETPKMIKATGGFAKSEVWRQMMSDIFDTELVVPESYESSCLGACVLGLKAIGDIEDFQSFHRWSVLQIIICRLKKMSLFTKSSYPFYQFKSFFNREL